MVSQKSHFARFQRKSWVARVLTVAVVAGLMACARAPVSPRPETFSPGDHLVGTYYFYWYKWPTEHFFDGSLEKRDDALTDHFPRPKTVDYESVAWHERELSDIAWCGIDFVLPVYWGAPGAYDLPHGIFSVRGLDALQKARDELLARGKRCPRIGMFFDTSTLLNALRREKPLNGKPDLTTSHGKEVFYGTIRDYWRRLDRKHWATLGGRPIIGLYSASFAAGFDQSTFDYLDENFERDFGVRPHVIAERSWRRIKAGGFYRWGAALGGPFIDDVAQIGPGYDDRAVPGRSTPIRDREDGRFYEHSWVEAIKSGRPIVLIETWNEMHEGTSICDSAEYGRKYMRLTRKYVRLWKSRAKIKKEIELEHPKPLPRGPSHQGRQFAEERDLFIDFAKSDAKGLRIVGQPDGVFETTQEGGRRCVRATPAETTYLYFAVPDPFFYNLHERVLVEIEYLDSGSGMIILQYDSHDQGAHLGGAYTTGETIQRQGTGRWLAHTFRLDNAAFLNRQNGATDFRFALTGDPVCLSRVAVRKPAKKK